MELLPTCLNLALTLLPPSLMSVKSTPSKRVAATAEATYPLTHFSHFVEGRIGDIPESIHKPIATTLYDVIHPRERGAELAEVIHGLRGRSLNTRPFVVNKSPNGPGAEAEICLLATFGGRKLSELDLAMQHFSIPAGSAMMQCGDVVPLQIEPNWPTPNQFIICKPILLDWGKKPRMRKARMHGVKWYQLTPEAQTRLANLIDDRKESLSSMSLCDQIRMRNSYLVSLFASLHIQNDH